MLIPTEEVQENYAALSLETRAKVDELVATMVAHEPEERTDLDTVVFAVQQAQRLFPEHYGGRPEQELVAEFMLVIQLARHESK